jgi:hypothetical protein
VYPGAEQGGSPAGRGATSQIPAFRGGIPRGRGSFVPGVGRGRGNYLHSMAFVVNEFVKLPFCRRCPRTFAVTAERAHRAQKPEQVQGPRQQRSC